MRTSVRLAIAFFLALGVVPGIPGLAGLRDALWARPSSPAAGATIERRPLSAAGPSDRGTWPAPQAQVPLPYGETLTTDLEATAPEWSPARPSDGAVLHAAGSGRGLPLLVPDGAGAPGRRRFIDFDAPEPPRTATALRRVHPLRGPPGADLPLPA